MHRRTDITVSFDDALHYSCSREKRRTLVAEEEIRGIRKTVIPLRRYHVSLDQYSKDLHGQARSRHRPSSACIGLDIFQATEREDIRILSSFEDFLRV